MVAGDLLPSGVFSLASPSCCRKMLKLCGETEDKLAQELIHFELQVERDVIEPLFLLAEVSSGDEATRAVRLFSTTDDYCLSAWSGFPGVTAPSTVCQLCLPPVLVSVGVPLGKGMKLALDLLPHQGLHC